MSDINESHILNLELTKDHALHLRGIERAEVGEEGYYLHGSLTLRNIIYIFFSNSRKSGKVNAVLGLGSNCR